ncbi:hypothetical protein GGQ08_003226 [Salinibacter ruber]|jgi:hypothetical protein|nr:hypothetical protein [Salinibacter ruber]MCS4119353.1 hypothetical protein [Salinibacter ruber]MCS4139545.1 hypothetical protein [Salinibacter ruber]MCS4142623.1 hypothetical protein [Salinibacter ruber]MCS4198185.1 hypothetical protein [Salinibacter ruber]
MDDEAAEAIALIHNTGGGPLAMYAPDSMDELNAGE